MDCKTFTFEDAYIRYFELEEESDLAYENAGRFFQDENFQSTDGARCEALYVFELLSDRGGIAWTFSEALERFAELRLAIDWYDGETCTCCGGYWSFLWGRYSIACEILAHFGLAFSTHYDD